VRNNKNIRMNNKNKWRLVAAAVFNERKEVISCRRYKQSDLWQFVQGGIDAGESPQDSIFREMEEEIGLIGLGNMGSNLAEHLHSFLKEKKNFFTLTTEHLHQKILMHNNLFPKDVNLKIHLQN